jgi:hypothetical protein
VKEITKIIAIYGTNNKIFFLTAQKALEKISDIEGDGLGAFCKVSNTE